MNVQKTQLLDITGNDFQSVVEEALKDSKTPRVIMVGVAYIYSFDLDDFEIVKRHNLLGRYDVRANIEWHRCLERWLNDQTVILGGRTFTPTVINRNFKRVTAEGMEAIAGSLTGLDSTIFDYRSIGDGDVAGDDPGIGARVLSHEVDRINVNTTPDGGSLSRDGSTIYSIGNHAKTTPTPDDPPGGFTECGMHDTDSPTTDITLDYSIFDEPVPHEQNARAPGSTTVIYMCSG